MVNFDKFDKLDDRFIKKWEIVRIIPLVLIVLAIMFYAIHNDMHLEPEPEISTDGNLYVHYIDVGQGDSTFVQLPNGQTLLIDAGDKEHGQKVVDYIKSYGYTKIDYLVATHPHADHIGGMPDVLNNFTIDNFYMPQLAEESIPTTKTYLNLLETLEAQNIEIKTARAGISVLQEWNTKIEIVGPRNEYYESLNDYSACIKLEHGGRSFLFLGDAEKLAEGEILDDVRVDVLKIAHHGSETSNSTKFLRRVAPKIAVISVGADNQYGHPHQEVLDRLATRDVAIYRTDLNGTIVIKSDGVNNVVYTEK